MRTFYIGLCAALLACSVARAENYDAIHVSTSIAMTNTSVAVTNEAVQTGCFDYLWIDLGGYATPTVTVAVATSSMNGWPSRTLFSKAVTADAGFPVRQLVTSTAGVAATDMFEDLPLFFDKLIVTLSSANVTNTITADVYVYVAP